VRSPRTAGRVPAALRQWPLLAGAVLAVVSGAVVLALAGGRDAADSPTALTESTGRVQPSVRPTPLPTDRTALIESLDPIETAPFPSDAVPTPTAKATPAPTKGSTKSLTYDGTLSIVATFGQPGWSGTSLAYPVHLAISTLGAGRGHAYVWGGNVGEADGILGSSASGEPLSRDYVAHYSCAPVSEAILTLKAATAADAVAWFVELMGKGVHDIHYLDLVTDCAAVGHPIEQAMPSIPPFSPRPVPSSELVVRAPFVSIEYQPADGTLPFTPSSKIGVTVLFGGGSPIVKIDVTATSASGAVETYACPDLWCHLTIGPFEYPSVLIAATVTDALGRTASTSTVIDIEPGTPPTASPAP